MRTKSPNADFTDLERIIEALHEYAGTESANVSELGLTSSQAERAAIHLEWLSEFLENRRLYHKKQNKKKQLMEKALKRMLSADELLEIDHQADIAIGSIHTPEDAEEAKTV